MIGDKIKQLREEIGLKQSELAEKINVSTNSIDMYERNERVPYNETVVLIADFFCVTTDYLLGKSNM